MTAYTTYADGTTIAPPVGSGVYASAPGPLILDVVYDASKRNAAIADVITVANIPAGAVITSAVVQVVTVDAGGGTLTLGDAGSANGWHTAQALNAAGKFIAAGAYIVAGGKLIAANTPVTMTGATAAVTTAKVRIQLYGWLSG